MKKAYIQVTFEITVSLYSNVNLYFSFTAIYKNITSHLKYILLTDILYLFIKGKSYLQAIIKQVKVTVSPHNLQNTNIKTKFREHITFPISILLFKLHQQKVIPIYNVLLLLPIFVLMHNCWIYITLPESKEMFSITSCPA